MDERPQDMEFDQPRPMSKLRRLSDLGMDRQGGGEAKRRRMDVSLMDGPNLHTLFVNTPRGNTNDRKQSDQDFSDRVNSGATQLTDGRNDMSSIGK